MKLTHFLMTMAAFMAAISCSAVEKKPALPHWSKNPPAGCAIGISGPTLNPGDALRYAKRNARINLVTSVSDVHIQSVTYDDGDMILEKTSQQMDSMLKDSVIVGLESISNNGSGYGAEVHAMACFNEHSTQIRKNSSVPDWVFNASDVYGDLCVVAVAGPTMFAKDQKPAAEKDGARALAESLEMRIVEKLEDDGKGVVELYSKANVSPELIEHCAGKMKVKQEWKDEEGSGPVKIKDVLYLLVCM